MNSSEGFSGLLDQADFLYRHGVVSYQCTVYSPALGTRAIAPAMEAGMVFRKVGGKLVPDACYDGNHVVASQNDRPWRQQWDVLRAYWKFYNPGRLVDAMFVRRDPSRSTRVFSQIVAMLSLPTTIWRYYQWVKKLKRGPITFWAGLPELPWPVCHVGDGPEPGGLIQQAIKKDILDIPRLPDRSTAATAARSLPDKGTAASVSP